MAFFDFRLILTHFDPFSPQLGLLSEGEGSFDKLRMSGCYDLRVNDCCRAGNLRNCLELLGGYF